MKEFMIHLTCFVCLSALAVGLIMVVLSETVKEAGAGVGLTFLISFVAYLWYCRLSD